MFYIFKSTQTRETTDSVYSWIIRLISQSILELNDKFRDISNSLSGYHDSSQLKLRAAFRNKSKYRFLLFYGFHKYDWGKVYYIEDKVDFEMGNLTGHATISKQLMKSRGFGTK